MTTNVPASKGMKTFFIMWVGELVSLLGSGLTGFALSVWVYQNTGSVTQFAVVVLFTALPGLILTPIIGTLADKWDRRLLIIGSDCCAAVATAFFALLFYTGGIRVWEICILNTVLSTSGIVMGTAFMATLTSLVPNEQLGRANGIVQFAEGSQQVLSPILGAVLILTIKVHGILVIDFVSYLAAIIALGLVTIPRPEPGVAGADQQESRQESMLSQATYGWRYLRARAGLFGLMIFFGATNLASAFSNLLITPLVLSFSTVNAYGVLGSAVGVGLISGSVLMSIWGGPSKRIHGAYFYGGILGAALIVAGLRPNIIMVISAMAVLAFSGAIANSSIVPIFQTRAAANAQGRILATVSLVARSTVPLSYLVSGPLVDKFFNPLLLPGGPLAGSVGRILGVGPGRGIGLFFVILGLFVVLTTLRAYGYAPLRSVETDVTDVVEAEAPVAMQEI